MGIDKLSISTSETSVVIGIKETLSFIVVNRLELLKNLVKFVELNKCIMMEDLEGATLEIYTVDRDIRLAVNNSFIYISREVN